MMQETNKELKQIVEEHIKILGAKYEDQTNVVKDKNQNIQWQFRVGSNFIVRKNTDNDGRVHVSVTLQFNPSDSKLLTSTNPTFMKTDFQISEICTICGVGHQWVNFGDDIAGLALFDYVDELVLDRISFHKSLENMIRVSNHVKKILHANFGNIAKDLMTGEKLTSSIYD